MFKHIKHILTGLTESITNLNNTLNKKNDWKLNLYKSLLNKNMYLQSLFSEFEGVVKSCGVQKVYINLNGKIEEKITYFVVDENDNIFPEDPEKLIACISLNDKKEEQGND